MGFRSLGARIWSHFAMHNIRKWRSNPLEYQDAIFKDIVKKATDTDFGKKHQFADIQDYLDFKNNVPIYTYEDLKPYIDKILAGEKDVLWPGKPKYFAKTSGTTSGAKYIPITKASVPNHINSARNMLLSYVRHSGEASFLDGKLMFLSGSPYMDKKVGILTGRLSGIVNHHVPGYLRTNQIPDYETNCIEDWDKKVEKMASLAIGQDLRLISGIPPWMMNFFEKIRDITGKKIIDVFPNLSVIAHGGVNFEPYKESIFDIVGKKLPTLETYPASEGFIAFQDDYEQEGLLLNVASGIFFEFIPIGEAHSENPTRLKLSEVEVNKQYVVIINSNAGLWGYNIGDTVKFVSTFPHRVKVTGRVKHFISAFGEHVIAEEVEETMSKVADEFQFKVHEFTVAPQVNPDNGALPYHEWFIEFAEVPYKLEALAARMDELMRQKNSYYADLVNGKILQPLKITPMKEGGFVQYMRSIGKFGGQNKLPRLSNDRKIADKLNQLILPKDVSS